MRSEKMIKYLPVYERSSKVFRDIINAEAEEIDYKALDIEGFLKQLSIDTATWGLDTYEKELGIKTDINKSYEERRSVIKSKYRGIGKFDKALLESIANAYSNGETKASFNGKLNVLFEDIKNNILNLNDFENTLEEIKPAHLDYTMSIKANDEIELRSKALSIPVIFPICNQIVAGGEVLW